ncbi:MAG: hypothetical protein AB1791_10280 [Chloroflexota bacterium]
MEPEKTSITLWGPPSSGKSWLVAAFARRVYLLSRKFESVEKFGFTLIDLQTNKPVDVVKPPNIKATAEPRVQRFRFVRKGLGKDLRSQISSHSHIIELIDHPGAAVTGIDRSANQTMAEEQRKEQQETLARNQAYARSQLIRAECIIIMLDRAEKTEAEIQISDYLKALSELRGILNEEQKQRYIVGCLTKADKRGLGADLIQTSDVEALVTRRFGDSSGEHILNILKDLRGDGYNVMLSAVSSLGYINSNPDALNWDTTNGTIQEVDKWEPINVEQPFLGFFQHIEKKRIEQATKHSGLFYQAYRGAIHSARQTLHVSYPELVEEAKSISNPGRRAVSTFYETGVQLPELEESHRSADGTIPTFGQQ